MTPMIFLPLQTGWSIHAGHSAIRKVFGKGWMRWRRHGRLAQIQHNRRFDRAHL